MSHDNCEKCKLGNVIIGLKNKVQTLEAKNKELTSDKEFYVDSIKKLNNQIDVFKNKLEVYKTQFDDMENYAAGLEAECHMKQNKYGSLMAKYLEVRCAFDELKVAQSLIEERLQDKELDSMEYRWKYDLLITYLFGIGKQAEAENYLSKQTDVPLTLINKRRIIEERDKKKQKKNLLGSKLFQDLEDEMPKNEVIEGPGIPIPIANIYNPSRDQCISDANN